MLGSCTFFTTLVSILAKSCEVCREVQTVFCFARYSVTDLGFKVGGLKSAFAALMLQGLFSYCCALHL